jgi:hypothetical protein
MESNVVMYSVSSQISLELIDDGGYVLPYYSCPGVVEDRVPLVWRWGESEAGV